MDKTFQRMLGETKAILNRTAAPCAEIKVWHLDAPDKAFGEALRFRISVTQGLHTVHARFGRDGENAPVAGWDFNLGRIPCSPDTHIKILQLVVKSALQDAVKEYPELFGPDAQKLISHFKL